MEFIEFKQTLINALLAKNKDAKDFYVALSYLKDVSVTESYLINDVDKETERKLIKIIYLRTKKNKPLNLILKTQNFYGREFFVNRHVLKPRFDTEVLVEKALSEINSDSKVLDLCCGSGNIGITLALEKNADVTLSDISAKALKVAKKNADKFFAKVKFIKSDLFKNINESKKFDYIISNPPYLAENELMKTEPEVNKYDPKLALVGGETGYEFYENISKDASKYLKPDGKIFLEVGFSQAKNVTGIFEKQGYSTEIFKDLNGIDRVVVCKYKKDILC